MGYGDYEEGDKGYNIHSHIYIYIHMYTLICIYTLWDTFLHSFTTSEKLQAMYFQPGLA